MESPVLREALGMQPGQRGVLVRLACVWVRGWGACSCAHRCTDGPGRQGDRQYSVCAGSVGSTVYALPTNCFSLSCRCAVWSPPRHCPRCCSKAMCCWHLREWTSVQMAR